MSVRIVHYLLIQLLFTAGIISGQTYKAEYNKLKAPLLEKEPPVICILEQGSSLFDTLGKYPQFTKIYTCYSPRTLSELKNQLNVDKFNPEDKKFLQAVRNRLSAGYIINWNTTAESNGIYLLEIFSTRTSSRIYTKKFFPSINSNPYNDVKKLLIDSLETYYKLASGEIIITANAENVRFKLMKGEKLVLEWKGDLKQQTAAGTYNLVSEAENYLTQETEVVVQEGRATSVNIKLEPQFSKYIRVISGDEKISNIKTEINNEKVGITYDLAGRSQSEFNIKVRLKDKTTGNLRDLKMIFGDVNKVKPGSNKSVSWKMLQELGTLPAEEYELFLSADKSGGVPWYYYAGGAALLGGVTLLLGGGNDTPPSSVIKAGTPPGRP